MATSDSNADGLGHWFLVQAKLPARLCWGLEGLPHVKPAPRLQEVALFCLQSPQLNKVHGGLPRAFLSSS